MNALELADELENKPLAYGDDIQEWLMEAASMLRTLHAENEELKAENQFFKDLMGDVEILRKAQEK